MPTNAENTNRKDGLLLKEARRVSIANITLITIASNVVAIDSINVIS
jgi:hypothetical protein